ncbi:hypothetical protein BKA62DRAFT_670824 [Auriculariales sp. MPI-PUGE-AT-0066]|nr:hypothetical protein BKA62DRAFT_670824 [Auriculariales sp. MPI-PUGE-AT-0066]
MRSILAVFLAVVVAVATPVGENEPIAREVIEREPVVEHLLTRHTEPGTSVVRNVLEARLTGCGQPCPEEDEGYPCLYPCYCRADSYYCIPSTDGTECFNTYKCKA